MRLIEALETTSIASAVKWPCEATEYFLGWRPLSKIQGVDGTTCTATVHSHPYELNEVYGTRFKLPERADTSIFSL